MSAKSTHTAARRSRNQERRWLTQAEAAEYLDVSPRTIRNYIAAGYLSGYRLGPRALRLDARELDSMLRRIPTVDGDAA